MNNITYAVSVDVNNPIIPYNVYVANVLDSNVRYLEITLYQNGNVIALSDEATATASLVTDDVLIDDNVECTISNNIITVPLEDLQRHGNLDLQVTVTEGEKVLAIPFPIQVRVTPNIAEEAQIDEDSLGSYAEVVQEIAAARKGYDSLDERLNSDASGMEAVINKVQSIGSQSQTFDNVKYPSVTAVRDYVNTKADKTDTNAQFERLIAVLQSKASKAETLAGYGINDAYTKAETDSLVSTDPTLSVQGKAADAREVGDKLDGVPFDLTFTTNDVIDGYFIGNNGAQVATSYWFSTDYCYVPLEKGGTLEITSTIYVNGGVAFYDQNKTCLRAITGNNAAEYGYTASSAPQTRTFTVPESTAYVRICAYKSTPTDMSRVSLLRIRKGVGLNQVVNELGSLNIGKANAEELAELKNMEPVAFIDGCYFHSDYGELISYSGYKCAKINVSLLRGGHVSLATYTDGSRIGIGFVDPDRALIEGFASAAGVYNFDSDIPENAAYLYVSVKKAQESKFTAPVFTWGKAFMQAQSDDVQSLHVNNQYARTANTLCPVLRDGTTLNVGNAAAVHTRFLSKIDNRYDYVEIRFIGEAEEADGYAFSYTAYDENASEEMNARTAYADNSIAKKNYNIGLATKTTEPYIRIPLSELTGYQYISATVEAFNGSQPIPLRIADNQYCLKITYKNHIITDDISDGAITSDKLDPEIEIGLTRRDVMNNEIKSLLLQSRYVGGDPEASDYASPLTLLHFSDIHADADALNRIYSDCEDMDIDDKICTGDIVRGQMAWISSSAVTYNDAQNIPNWWKPDIMITVGNHDTAAYDGKNKKLIWNYLTMAQCDQYLIAPFEANWGVTHTAGTSYYYKDYTDSKVRLIVIDGMLYDVEGSQDAVSQTAWLGNLLDGAIADGLHVLIATHGIATGAHAKSCTFSKRGTYTSNQTIQYTPPDITELVRTKINNGLHFVGYLCGHLHQDFVWDVYNDGTQLMYCITCASSSALQSRNSDQGRDATADAYNLVTIDTKNQLVKLIRGGGANSDKYHRNRKAICFHYGTGEIYGE